MIHNYSSWTTKNHQKYTFHATKFNVDENSRTFQGKMEFKDFSRCANLEQGT